MHHILLFHGHTHVATILGFSHILSFLRTHNWVHVVNAKGAHSRLDEESAIDIYMKAVIAISLRNIKIQIQILTIIAYIINFSIFHECGVGTRWNNQPPCLCHTTLVTSPTPTVSWNDTRSRVRIKQGPAGLMAYKWLHCFETGYP